MSAPQESAVPRFRRELRTFRSSPLNWLLLVGDRIVIAAILTVIFGVGATAIIGSGVVAANTSTSLLYVFQGLVTGNLTLVTIVLSINQLVLSRELNTPGELEEKIDHVVDFRDRVRETTGSRSVPITPAAFLEELVVGIRESAEALRAAAGESDDRTAADVESVVEDVVARADTAEAALDGADTDVFGALAVALEINFARELRDARRIRSTLDAGDPPAVAERLDEVVEGLGQVDVARQYFKSLYMQTELARFSRLLLYVGVPAIASGLLLLTTYAGATAPAFGGVLNVVVPLVVTVSFAPLALLFAFVLRVSIVAERTVAVTPFTMAPAEKEILDDEA